MNAAFLKLEEAKEGLERFIRDKRESLANLKPQLASILEVSRETRCMHRAAVSIFTIGVAAWSSDGVLGENCKQNDLLLRKI